jgi:serine/threonine-protein kinase
MDSADPEPSAFDELLDLRFRGEKVDAGAFLAAHPNLTESEREQIRKFCRSRAPHEPSSPTDGAAGADPPDQSPPIPRLGGYRLGHRLGAGGMGAVFLAQDESLGRPVAVKILGPDLLGTGERSERFLREARAVARLRHPNIVDVYAAGEQDGFRYLAMELLRGASLHDLIADAASRGTRLAVGDLVRWGTEIARALQAAHEAHVIHRDVKPSNIRITEDARAVLLDFGLALEDGAATLTESGAFRGSPQYASPEQVGVAGVPIDARTDVYSLGATLYEGLTGVAPFRGETREQLFNHILSSEPAPPRKLDPSIPRDLETVVLAALEKDPARRYASAAALAADLEAFRDGRAISVRPISAPGRLFRWAKRQPVKAGLGATAILALLATAVLGGFVLSNLDRLERAAKAEQAGMLARLLEQAFLEYGEGGDLGQAVPIFEEALAVDSGSDEATAGVALARIAAGGFTDALAACDRGRGADDAAFWRGRLKTEALEELRRKGDADALLAKLPPPSTALDFFVLGMLELKYFHAGRKEAADRAFGHLRRAIQSSPSARAIHHYELGHAAWHAGRHEEAREEAAVIAQLFPDSPERTYAIARTLRDADPDAALEAFAKAARSPPRGIGARQAIAVKLVQSGKPELVELGDAVARAMHAQDPGSAGVHSALGAIACAKNDLTGAVAEFQEALRLDPRLRSVHRMLAETFIHRKEHAAALAPAREAVRRDPRDSAAWNALGCALKETGQPDQALGCFEKALALAPESPHALCNAGTMKIAQGEFAKGLELVTAGAAKAAGTPRWSFPSDQWITFGRYLVALEKRFDEFRRGEGEPPPVKTRINFANQICRPKGLYAEAVRLFEESFQIDPDLADQSQPRYRLCAAVTALAAGSGEGKDAPEDPAERARLRGRARAWFAEDLAACEARVRDVPSSARLVAGQAGEWKAERGLAKTRAPDQAGIPAAEAAEWGALWARCDALEGAASSRVSR